jgi:hypothetical protein
VPLPLGLLKRWQEHLVLCGDVDAIARPQPHRMAALLGDEAEAIPLSLEDPLFVVEGFVDELPGHPNDSWIRFRPRAAGSLTLNQPTPAGCPRGHRTPLQKVGPLLSAEISLHRLHGRERDNLAD